MIQINSFCVGNKEKSFYLDNFSNGVNIIYSYYNNKGKTIVLQGIMYALGNNPTFPSDFGEYKDCYFIIELNKDDKNFYICRKKNYFFVLDNNQLIAFDSVSVFQKYFNKNICRLPVINKNGIEQMAGLELYFEMFFLPQDKRQTSNTFNRRYTKDDYMECIYYLMNCENPIDLEYEDREKLKIEIQNLDTQKKILKRKNEFLNSKNKAAIQSTYTAYKSMIDKKIIDTEKCSNLITDLQKEINKWYERKSQNESLLKELKSLSRNRGHGKLVCLECGSEKIAYSTPDLDIKSSIKFEISNDGVRKKIIKIIQNRIQDCDETIVDLESRIIEKQQELTRLIDDDDVNIEHLLFYKDEIKGASKFDNEILNIDKKILELKTKLNNKSHKTNIKNKNSREDILNHFIENMNYFYKYTEHKDPLTIDAVFTKNNLIHSGSQEALFLMSRIYACSKLLNNDFPIVIDSFRDGELSSTSEEKVINLFCSLNKQMIFTCTLKSEEENKYDNKETINGISFDNVIQYALLQENDNQKFRELLQMFSINIDIQ